MFFLTCIKHSPVAYTQEINLINSKGTIFPSLGFKESVVTSYVGKWCNDHCMFSSVPVWSQLVEACTGGLPEAVLDVNPFTYFDDGLLDTLRVINFLKAQCKEAVGYKRRTENRGNIHSFPYTVLICRLQTVAFTKLHQLSSGFFIGI